MQIVCPTCAAVYQVPGDRLERRKSVRCTRCGEGWAPGLRATAPESAAPAENEPEAEPEAVPVRPPPVTIPLGLDTRIERYESRLRAPLILPSWNKASGSQSSAWIASIAVVLLSLVVLFANHEALAEGWPPLQRLYGLFGLT